MSPEKLQAKTPGKNRGKNSTLRNWCQNQFWVKFVERNVKMPPTSLLSTPGILSQNLTTPTMMRKILSVYILGKIRNPPKTVKLQPGEMLKYGAIHTEKLSNKITFKMLKFYHFPKDEFSY
jgi:hypothetical protein